MAIALRTIATNIAALTVTGLTIYDLDNIPEAIDGRVPIMYPEPAGFVSNLLVERDAMGTGVTAKKVITYTLTYTFAYCRTGTGRIGFEKYPAMVSLVAETLDKLIDSDASITGAVLMDVNTVTDFGPVTDPSGALCHGCRILVDIKEFIH